MKSLLRSLLLLTALGGLVLALWPAGQMLYADRSQAALLRQFQAAKKEKVRQGGTVRSKSASHAAMRQALSPGKVRRASGVPAAPPRSFPPTRLVCPDAELDAVVVRGVQPDDLRRGPGWMPGSALPGHNGNCVIAGHRNIYGSPFARLDVLMPGSVITVQTADDSYRYLVVSVHGAADNDPSVTAPPTDGSARLTLYTCTVPKTTDRLIVSAVKTE